MNILIISGRLGQDAETKYTAGGKPVANFSIAVDSGYGENKKTNWFRCALFGKRAEGGLIPYLTKGTQVIVTGEVSLNEYESQGQNKASLSVFVDKVELVGGRQSAESKAPAKPQDAPKDDFMDKDIPF